MNTLDTLSDTIASLNAEAQHKSPTALIGSALLALQTKAVLSTSFGAEDQVLTDLLVTGHVEADIITLDTGRLFNETLETYERTVSKYGPVISVFFPESKDVETYVNLHGPNAFYDSVELRKECCFIRKIRPLERALKGYGIWITGLRADQSENRSQLPVYEWDERHKLVKVNPLLHWTLAEVMEYLHKNSIPYNPLHDKGYVSIGCAPCTRAVEEGEDFRAGRWWWESSKKECGLHRS